MSFRSHIYILLFPSKSILINLILINLLRINIINIITTAIFCQAIMSQKSYFFSLSEYNETNNYDGWFHEEKHNY